MIFISLSTISISSASIPTLGFFSVILVDSPEIETDLPFPIQAVQPFSSSIVIFPPETVTVDSNPPIPLLAFIVPSSILITEPCPAIAFIPLLAVIFNVP